MTSSTNSANLSSDFLSTLRTHSAHAFWRKHPLDPVAWVLMARPTIKGQPLRLTPALETIYRDPAETIVIQKSAQVGITEMLVSLALFYADRGLVVLYVMPYQNVADDLVSARVDPAIDDSRYLRGRLRTQARKGADRKRLKRIWGRLRLLPWRR